MSKVWYVENTWSCESCGSSSQKGRHLTCQNCGAPKGAKVVDRIPDPDTAPAVVDSDRLREAKAGRNWVCEYCGKRYCAADRQEENPTVERSQGRTGGRAYTPARTRREQRIAEDSEVHSLRPIAWWRHRKNQVIAGICILAVTMLTWCGIWLFKPREVDTQVSQITWKYTKHLKQRETRHGSGWEDNRPSSHFNDSCHTRQRGTRNCHPHQCNPHTESYSCRPHSCNCRNVCTDQGNGYSRCTQQCSTCYDTCTRTVYDTCYDQCPVYDEWCSYDYYTWPTIKTRVNEGHDHKMKWPTLEAVGPLQKVESISWYEVIFSGDDDSWKIHPDTAGEFRQYKLGARWKIEVNRAGRVKPLHELKAEQ